ncbi:MAG: DoxX family protein [Verrucomicrobia bacterium]|nr:DoxX family protein [Verrucomicrobiota bacterium]
MNPKTLYLKLDALLATLGGWLASPFLLAVRLYWGWGFFQTGKGKLLNLERTAGFFASLHLPAPKLNAVAAGSVECFGGLLLLLGLGGRIVPVPLIFTMLVAYATAERDALRAITSDPDQFTAAAPFLFLLAALTIFVFGPGKLSLDALLGRKQAASAKSA